MEPTKVNVPVLLLAIPPPDTAEFPVMIEPDSIATLPSLWIPPPLPNSPLAMLLEIVTADVKPMLRVPPSLKIPPPPCFLSSPLAVLESIVA